VSTGVSTLGTEKAERISGGLPSWVGLPFRLRRFPGVLAAVAGAAAILAMATAAAPLFLSSTGTAALSQALAGNRGQPALTVVGFGPVSARFLDSPDRALSEAGRSIGGLRPSVLTLVSDTSSPSGTEAEDTTVRLLSRAGFLSNVQVEGPAGTSGVWIPSDAPAELGASGTLTLEGGGHRVSVPVAGRYRALDPQSLSAFWRPVADSLSSGDASKPGTPVVLVDAQTFLSTGERLQGTARYQWDFALAPGTLSLPQAQSLSDQIEGLRQEIADPNTAVGDSFHRGDLGTAAPFTATNLTELTQRAARIQAAIRGPVDTVALAGRILALLGLAAAGVYAVRRRRIESALLSSRGVGPSVQGAVAAGEAVLPVLAGAALGWGVALVLVTAFGPSRSIETAAERSAAYGVAATAAVALLFLAVAAAVAARRELEEVTGRLPKALARTPWEAVVLAVAAAAFYEITTRSSATVTRAGAPGVDRLLLLFPLLFIAGLAGLAVRGLRAFLGRSRASGRGWPDAPYLAVRRLASASRVALLLVTAASLAVGILVYASMVSSSVASTARLKAHVRVGSDVAVPVAQGATIPASLGVPTITVARVEGASALPGPEAVDVLVVDPSTFETSAFWDDSFSSRSLPDLLTALNRPAGSRAPVVVAGSNLSGNIVVRFAGTSVPALVVGSASAFPGMNGDGRPMVVVSSRELDRVAPAAAGPANQFRWLWANGDKATVTTAVQKAGLGTVGAISASQIEGDPAFLAVSWTFSFLEALGVVAGFVALIGLTLYLQAQQQSREVAYALSARMGLSARSHRSSVALELGGMLLASFVLGSALAAMATRLVYRRLDVFPAQPPAPVYRIPLTTLGLVAAALAVAALVGAWAVQRRASRANVAEVLRLAG
jgi:putative ABC transport system permease protein